MKTDGFRRFKSTRWSIVLAAADRSRRGGTAIVAMGVRIDREKTPKRFLPRLDQYVFTAREGRIRGGYGDDHVLPCRRTVAR